MTETEAKKLLKYWQSALRLNDWTVALNYKCSPCDMLLKDVEGETEYTESIKTACIRIIDKKYYGERIVPFDFEKVLVHELLHLKFSLLSDGENELQNRIVHQIIEDMAKTLTEVYRANPKTNN